MIPMVVIFTFVIYDHLIKVSVLWLFIKDVLFAILVILRTVFYAIIEEGLISVTSSDEMKYFGYTLKDYMVHYLMSLHY